MFTVFILSLLLTIALVPVLKSVAFRMKIVDMPNERKVHARPMPKTGGLSMAFGVFVPILLWLPQNDFVLSVCLGALIIVIFGMLDDIRSMGFKQKMVPQILAAGCVIFFGNVQIKWLGIVGNEPLLLSSFISVPLTCFVIVGVTNAINLSDGLDGLAGGISMLSFVMISFLAYQGSDHLVALMAIAVVAAVMGFLRYNTYPAILFMGDAGSQLLGFLSVVFALVLTQTNTPYSRLLSLPLIGFPILDTCSVMVERILAGRSPFKADQNHFHHRLLKRGFSHSQAVLIIYVIQACYLSAAFIFRFYPDWVHLLIFTVISLIILSGMKLADLSHWQFESRWVSKLFKLLRYHKNNQSFVRLSFGVVRTGLPIILLFQCFIPVTIPSYLSMTAITLVGLRLGLMFFKSVNTNLLIRFSICLVFPLILYLCETTPAAWFDTRWFTINNLIFIVLMMVSISTIRLTRRKKGFKVTPMDILVFIVILIFPNLPTIHLQTNGASIAFAKALVVFWGLDVLMGELRGETKFLEVTSMITLGAIFVRGMIG